MADIEISRKPPLAPGSVPAAALARLSFAGQPAPSGFIFYLSLTHTRPGRSSAAQGAVVISTPRNIPARRGQHAGQRLCAARRVSAAIALPLLPSFLSTQRET